MVTFVLVAVLAILIFLSGTDPNGVGLMHR